MLNCDLALWPLFHYLLWQDVATEYASADTHWAPYEAVNVAFAKRVADVYRLGDPLWIPDYYLFLVPSLFYMPLPGPSCARPS